MIVHKKEKYTLISSDENSFKEFQNLFFEKINDFETDHLILQISEEVNIENDTFLLFLNVAKQKKKNGTSFVIINSVINIDNFLEGLNIVPTLQEAEDTLVLEAVERDLGF